MELSKVDETVTDVVGLRRVDVLFRMPDKIIERSIEHEVLALEDARSVAEKLKHDSVAVHTGALRYLGVEERK